MSHFTCLVIGKDPTNQLAPFDENKRVERYVKHTKKQLIDNQRKEWRDWLKSPQYKELKKDPIKYAENSGIEHIEWLKSIPKLLKQTDEAVYKEAIKHYEPDEIGKDGEVYSTYNPQSKWDWHQLGGRWTGFFKLKKGKQGTSGTPGIMTESAPVGTTDSALKKDIVPSSIKSTFAVLKDGKWYERGEMGWWAIVSNEISEKKWQTEFKKLIDKLPDDTLLSVFDLHI